MKTRLLLMSLLLVSGCFVIELSAQTKKTTTKRTASRKSNVANKSRARGTNQTSPQEQSSGTETAVPTDPKPETSPQPTTKVDKPTEAKQADQETKKTEIPQSEPNKPVPPSDPVAELKDQINAEPGGPERIRLRLRLVEELVNRGNKVEALSELHAITNTDVFDPQDFYNAGNSFARLDNIDGAVQAYRKAIDQRNGRYSRALNNLGVVFLRAGRWDEAYDALLSALKLESFRYPEASYNLGRLYAARGQSDLAVREWRRVLAINPGHTAAAQALARAGNEGRVVVEPIRVVSPRPTEKGAKSGAGVETIAVAEKTVSLARSTKPLVLDQTSFDLMQRARNSNEKGNTLDAIDNYKRLLLRQSGYFPPANLELSFALLSLKRYDEALGNLEMVANRDGARYPISYFHLARVYELQGNLQQAETLFSRAVTSFGAQNSQFLLDVSRVREKQGNFKGALEAMERYLMLMQQQGEEPSWSDDRLTALRQKVAAAPKQ